MKKIFVALVTLFTLASCARTEISVVDLTDFVKLSEEADSIGLTCTVNAACLNSYKHGKQAMDNINGHIVEHVFGDQFVGLPVLDAAYAYIDTLGSDYRLSTGELYDDLKQYVADDPEASFPFYALMWEYSVGGEFVQADKGLVSYLVYNYQYLGGAHGSTAVYPLVMRAETGEIVREDEFFVQGYEEPVAALIEAAIMEDDDISEMLFEDVEIRPNGNYIVGEEGVTWFFQEYEIGPYALGTVKAFVPFEKLRPFIRPKFEKLK